MILAKRITVVTKLLLIIFVLVLSLVSISIIVAVKTDQREIIEIDSASEFEMSSKLSSNGETVFLPGTNLSVSEYLDGVYQFNYNTTIESMNNSHWNVRCDYSRTLNLFHGQEFPNSFHSSVNRTGYFYSFNVTNYYDWRGYSAETFDFWSDTSDFYDGYSYTSSGVLITVTEVNNFYLAGMGYYDSWKQSGTDPGYGPFTIYSSKQGLFLSMEFTYISVFNYNLTFAEFNEGPEGTIDSPLSGVVGSQLTVEWSTTDNQSSMLNQTVYVSREQTRELVATTGFRSTGSQSITVSTSSLTEGTGYYMELELNDGFIITTMNTSSTTFTIDRTSPVIQDIDPDNESVVLPESSITITFDEEPEECYSKWDSGVFTDLSGNPAVLTAPQSDGQHSLTINATDIAGNSRLTSYRYTVDGSPPTFVQISPSNGSTRHSGTIITIQFADDSGMGTNYYQWDDGSNTTVLSTLPAGDEVHELFVTAVDILGNSKLYYFVFTTDDNLPGVSLVSPQNNSEVKGNSQVSLVVFIGNGSIIYNWNGASNLTVDEGEIILIPQDEAVHVFNVYICSPLDDWASDRFVFIVDNTPPGIDIPAQLNGSSIKSDIAIHIMVTGSNGSLYYAWDDGANSSIHYPQDNMVYSPRTEGSKILHLYSSDIARNWAHILYEYIIDNTPPNITIITPESSGYYQSDVLLQYTNDTEIDSFYLDGISQDIPLSGHILTSFPDGSHNLTFIADDEAGNDVSVTVTFTVDTLQPVITIDGIANTTYRINLIEFGVEINEVSTAQVTISKLDGSILYNTTFSAWIGYRFPVIASDFEDGYYLLTVNATDRAGNNAEVKVYFTVHISSFELDLMLEAKIPRTIPVVDENGNLWFDLTLTSKTQQNFTLEILTAGELTGPGNQILSTVKFTCDTPEDIIYMSFAHEVNDTSAIDPNIPVYQWVYWDNSSWNEIPTSFNYLSFTWEATFEGSLTFITLTVTDETLNVAEITNTELFPTPAMDIVTAIFSMFSVIFLRRKLLKTKTKE